jgi:ATP-dependent Lhr-like helicase
VVFRRLIAREATGVAWRDLARVYRRLEARGEIRGGRFIAGLSGEQFALPEAIAPLRAVRKRDPAGERLDLAGADPLNLAGLLWPGARVPRVPGQRLRLREGLPEAAPEPAATDFAKSA